LRANRIPRSWAGRGIRQARHAKRGLPHRHVGSVYARVVMTGTWVFSVTGLIPGKAEQGCVVNPEQSRAGVCVHVAKTGTVGVRWRWGAGGRDLKWH